MASLLDTYHAPRRKKIIYMLVDSGNHMRGDKIGSLNSAIVEGVCGGLASCAEHLDHDLYLQIISYGSGAKKMFDEPELIAEICWEDLISFGSCDFGSAIFLLEEEMQKDHQNYGTTYPAIIAFSGNKSTDEYEQYISRISKNPLFKNAVKIGVRIGDNADTDALIAFTKTPEAVININEVGICNKLICRYDYDDCALDPEEFEHSEQNTIDLKTILKQNPNCLNSRASFKSTLLGMYPSEKRIINILAILFECGIANKIKEKKILDSDEMQEFIMQIENEYGISKQYSQDAILIWASAFDVVA